MFFARVSFQMQNSTRSQITKAIYLNQISATIKAWVNGARSTFDPKKDLEPILKSGSDRPGKAPVNVFT